MSVLVDARDGGSGGVGLVAMLQTHLRGGREVWHPFQTYLRGPGAPGRGVAPDDDMGRMVVVRRATFVLWLLL